MTSIKRKTPPQHFLIVDTNCLWHRDKTYVINPEFQEFWDAHTLQFDLKLVIPEVVKGEILYQQTTSTLRTLERANKQFDTLSKNTDKKYKHRLTEKRLRHDVLVRLDKWIKKVNASVEQTPVGSINWPNLITSAIWRSAPFKEDKEDKEIEKGFRDSLIMETVSSFCLERPDAEIAFVCNDRLLREATEERLKPIEKFSIYENIQAFEAYLKLTLEQLTEDFIRDVKRKAKDKFFSSHDSESLYYRDSINNGIRTKFQDKFTAPADGLGIANTFSTLLKDTPETKWISISDEKVWIYPPQFQNLENESTFHWKSNVVFVELFQRQQIESGGIVISTIHAQRKLQILRFAVFWKVKVGHKGRFMQMELEDLVFEERTFDIPINEQLDNYGIKPYLIESNESETAKKTNPTP